MKPTLALVFVCLSPTLWAQDCSSLGTLLGNGDETVFAIQPIGFAFPLGGATYSDIHVTTNGHCYLSNAGVPAPGLADYTATAAELSSGPPRVAALWTDLNMVVANNGEVYIDNASGTYCTITWKNAQNFGIAGSPLFNVQVKLYPSGNVDFFWSAGATNNSTIVAGQPGIVGVSPGQGALLPAPSDLGVGGATADVTLFEEWTVAQTFDLADNSLQLVATSPGYAFVPNGPQTNCSAVTSYGLGCISSVKSFHELMPTAAFDLSGTTVSMLRQASGYIVLDGIPGVFVPPSAAAQVVANADDTEQTVALTNPMPIVGGTTSSLTVCSNGRITLSATGNGITYTPVVATFLGWAEPNLAPVWHDYSPNQGGQILFEEDLVAGKAYVTWDAVWSYGAGTPQVGDTFQVQFDLASGDMTIVYVTMNNVGNGYLVGYSAGSVLQDPGAKDLSVALAATFEVGDTETVPLTLTGGPPLIGANWDLTTSNIDAVSPISLTFLGDAQIAIPGGLSLSTIGLNAPGCFAHINTILGNLSGPNTGGSSLVSLAIPNVPSLAGSVLTAQSLCLTLANSANLLTSNGVEGRIGF